MPRTDSLLASSTSEISDWARRFSGCLIMKRSERRDFLRHECILHARFHIDLFDRETLRALMSWEKRKLSDFNSH
ncbi:hypothetical protein PhaeoP75_03688 [Phaeobacter gallaeciensis]|uniref:Uncharacterized protein n=1 Tax=Phaeobacter gallaeciensis TaxID=60890 RepID=A0AAC9ZCL7_9RHOB|nr:hypothetical protein Gal_03653 [Phaeobacter gallaeciensis DSM 26640]ATE94629.1 hypothetical protein PhaeoP11_03639 [Phaeobacter gallaeciensis]ATE98902.1 hypothetical protein PhaeoP73_03637 [Phaeobacter gallaeciensis]ATF03293.1 hypothetical protein PhaeoP75_03688 [Phaeobacter gallaeciensis]ATF07673.1 hypothetical protein PhaeoP63_03637 [Phaeobacter gallaeciensis]